MKRFLYLLLALLALGFGACSDDKTAGTEAALLTVTPDKIEFDAANASGTYSCSATLNYGNINTNNVCVVQNGSTAELYYHFDSNYQAILVTVMSFYGGSTASYELTDVGVSAAPSNAIYAVNKNVAAKGVTPATDSNSDDVATTEWVNNKISDIDIPTSEKNCYMCRWYMNWVAGSTQHDVNVYFSLSTSKTLSTVYTDKNQIINLLLELFDAPEQDFTLYAPGTEMYDNRYKPIAYIFYESGSINFVYGDGSDDGSTSLSTVSYMSFRTQKVV